MSNTRSLLLVDDDRKFVDILTRRFLQLAFKVTAVHHPRQAMEAASFNQFDVAVIDESLPETAGIDLMEHLLGKLDLHVIILSGSADRALRREALQRGAFAYLLKPCKFVELKSVVDQALLHQPLPESGYFRNAGCFHQRRNLVSSSNDREAEQVAPPTELETTHEYAG